MSLVMMLEMLAMGLRDAGRAEERDKDKSCGLHNVCDYADNSLISTSLPHNLAYNIHVMARASDFRGLWDWCYRIAGLMVSKG